MNKPCTISWRHITSCVNEQRFGASSGHVTVKALFKRCCIWRCSVPWLKRCCIHTSELSGYNWRPLWCWIFIYTHSSFWMTFKEYGDTHHRTWPVVGVASINLESNFELCQILGVFTIFLVWRGADGMNTCEHLTNHINWHTHIWPTDKVTVTGNGVRRGERPPCAFCSSLLHLPPMRSLASRHVGYSAYKRNPFLPHVLKIKSYQEFRTFIRHVWIRCLCIPLQLPHFRSNSANFESEIFRKLDLCKYKKCSEEGVIACPGFNSSAPLSRKSSVKIIHPLKLHNIV